jgi:hypothetical protein
VDIFRKLPFLVAASVLASLSACGGDTSCVVRDLFIDPSGKWAGRLERVRSDCIQTRGPAISVEHSVHLGCLLTDQPSVTLRNEDGLEFEEESFSALGGGSFEVINESDEQRIEIRYEKFGGTIADVEQRIRIYRNGAIICSELYQGQVERRDGAS